MKLLTAVILAFTLTGCDSFSLEVGDCFAYTYNVVDGRPISYMHKVVEADKWRFCHVQSDDDNWADFYGTTRCDYRIGSVRTTKLECPTQ